MSRPRGLAAIAVAVGLFASSTSAASATWRPQVHLSAYPEGVRAIIRGTAGQCERDPAPAKISLQGQGHKMVVGVPDICADDESWWFSGHLPGGFSPDVRFVNAAGVGVEVFVTAGRANATNEFRVLATSRGSRATGWLTINRQRFWKYERIYEGSDAFVNFCIDRSQEIRSYHHRLFCWRESPVRGPDTVRFHRHRR